MAYVLHLCNVKQEAFLINSNVSLDREGKYYYQNHHWVMQRSVSVQRLAVPLDDVMPLHTQVNEASGLNLLSFSI